MRPGVLLALACLVAHSALAQAPAQNVRLTKPESASISLSTDGPGAQQRADAILRLRGYADRALGFRDVEAKVQTLTAMAHALWSYDEPSARQLFLQTYNYLKSIKVPEAGTAAAGETSLTAGRLSDLRDEIISTLAPHDASLARRLSGPASDAAPDAESARMDQRTAINLLAAGDAARASEFAARSLGAGVPQQMIGFLLQLRRRDERRADELYLQTLDRLLAAPGVDGMRLMELGTYVFTSPFLDQDMEEKGAMVIQSVGGVGVVNLSADRPGASPTMIHAYLSAAAQVLSRPTFDPQQQRLYYATGQQLLSKAQRFAPELVTRMAAAMQALAPSLPPQLTQSATYEVLGPKEDYTFEDTLREIDEISDPTLHDLRSVMIANGLCFSDDFTSARAVAERIKDTAIRARLLNLINSGMAHQAIAKGELNLAEEMARKLTPGIERAILWLAVARAHAQAGARGRAMEAINLALKDAHASAGPRPPYVLLKAAGELAQLDSMLAFQVFHEGIKLLNSGDGKIPRWHETVEIGGRAFPFSLRGDEGDASGVIDKTTRKLYAVNAQDTEAAVLSLKHELIMGKALRALSESMLASVPPEKRPGKTGK